MKNSENELAAIYQKLNEQEQELSKLRQAVSGLGGNGHSNGTSLLASNAKTDRRGMLKTMAGLAVGVAAVGMLRPSSSEAKTNGLSVRTATGGGARKNGAQPDVTGDPWIVGSDANNADASTGLINTTTDQIDTQLRIRNYGLTDFVPPLANIAVVGYCDTESSTLSEDSQIGGWFEARQTGASGRGTGVVGFAGADSRGVGGEFIGGDIGTIISGGRATICFLSTTEAFPPTTTNVHPLGELVVATDYSLWYSVTTTGVNPATFRRLASVETAGSLALLPVPMRIVDTRAGSGLQDDGMPFHNADARVYDIITLAGLPAFTTAVLARLTMMSDGSNHPGGVQASPNPPVSGANLGVGTAILNFSATDFWLGDGFTSRLDDTGHLHVSGFIAGGGSFEIVLDIIGYYL